MRKLLTLFAIVAAYTSQAMASAIDPAAYDRDTNRLLDRSERAAFRQALDNPQDPDEAFHWFTVLNGLEQAGGGNPEYVLLPDLLADAYEPAFECDPQRRFYLRRSLIDMPIFDCEEVRPKSFGAKATYIYDRVTEASSVAVNGAAGFMLYRPSSEVLISDVQNISPYTFESAVLLFTDVNGTFRSDGRENAGYARTGVNFESWHSFGIFDVTTTQGAAYYLTDLNGDASGYGAQLLVTPYSARNNLNTAVKWQDRDYLFYWTMTGHLDALHVDRPGGTALDIDSDYVWAGGRLGAIFAAKPAIWKNGIDLDVGYTFDWDFVNRTDASLFEASVNFNLDEDGASAISLNYVRGESRKDLVFKDRFSAALTVKY